jgi:hypothetical protein
MRKIDPNLYLLTGLVIFFSFLLLWVEYVFHDDGQVFQVFSNLLSGVGGALLLAIKGHVSSINTSGGDAVVTGSIQETK